MSDGTYTTAGAAIGTAIAPVVGTAIGTAVGTVADVIDSIFGNVDKGHWEGNKFIPGDLQSRIDTVHKYLSNRGLHITDVDFDKIMSLLETPSGWQDTVQAYLDDVKRQMRNGTYVNPNINTFSSNPETSIPNYNKPSNIPSNVETDQTNVDYLSLILILGAAVFILPKILKR